MDVHKNSIDIAIADQGRNGQVRHYGKIDGTLSALDKVVRKLVSKGKQLHFVYEAGPCGYQIFRHLRVSAINKWTRLRRILVHIQGASTSAY